MSLLELIDVMHRLSKLHYRILSVMEKNTRRFRYIPLQFLAKKVNIKPSKLENIMDFLVKNKLVKKKHSDYVGYELTYKGLDCLAIKALNKFGVITRIGPKMGMGKEGDIWIAYLNNVPRIIKLFRISPKSFRKIKIHRYYYIPKRSYSWLELSIKSAYREFHALNVLYESNISVPRPIARKKHAIVMDYIDGVELVKAKLQDPLYVLDKIVNEVRKVYEIGIIHADLSEFNIMITKYGDVYIFDWPQYITRSHPEAEYYLKRDLYQITRYFARKYQITKNEINKIVSKHFKNMKLLDFLMQSE